MSLVAHLNQLKLLTANDSKILCGADVCGARGVSVSSKKQSQIIFTAIDSSTVYIQLEQKMFNILQHAIVCHIRGMMGNGQFMGTK